jgi:hypothetical protein
MAKLWQPSRRLTHDETAFDVTNAQHYNETASADLDVQEPILENCLLIPLVIFAWYYWTRKKASRFFPHMLTNDTRQETDETIWFASHDPFCSWDEVDEAATSERQSMRLVMWLKGDRRQRVKRNTKRMLSFRRPRVGGYALRERILNDEEGGKRSLPLRVETVMSQDTVFSETAGWEVIHDVQTIEVYPVPADVALLSGDTIMSDMLVEMHELT